MKKLLNISNLKRNDFFTILDYAKNIIPNNDNFLKKIQQELDCRFKWGLISLAETI